ncbi:MAG TPA: 4Fe-4S binding protein [Tepidisphaeraceae bacterium]|jgi:electron transport complex protein RnfC|nr:4Fe-4S binding protein [Tepidisphaeraceae bacterium]
MLSFAQGNSVPTTLWGWPIEVPTFRGIECEVPTPLDQDAALEPILAAQRDDQVSWIDRLQSARVQAVRRNSPDLQQQLFKSMERPVDTIVCTILDVDPAACLNSAIASLYPREIHAAVILMLRITGATRAVSVIDDRVPHNWLGQLRRLTRRSGHRLVTLHNDYPQADPTLLLYTLLSRRLRPGRLPTEQGVLLFDGVAALAIGRAALAGESMVTTPVTVRDHARAKSDYFIAPAAMKVWDIMRQSRIDPSALVVRRGDVLRDLRVSPDDTISTGDPIFHGGERERSLNPDPCIRCGWCVEACPTNVQPAGLLEASQRNDLLLAERAGLEACIDCGICSFVCPSKLPLLVGIRKLRAAAQEAELSLATGLETAPVSNAEG